MSCKHSPTPTAAKIRLKALWCSLSLPCARVCMCVCALSIKKPIFCPTKNPTSLPVPLPPTHLFLNFFLKKKPQTITKIHAKTHRTGLQTTSLNAKPTWRKSKTGSQSKGERGKVPTLPDLPANAVPDRVSALPRDPGSLRGPGRQEAGFNRRFPKAFCTQGLGNQCKSRRA